MAALRGSQERLYDGIVIGAGMSGRYAAWPGPLEPPHE